MATGLLVIAVGPATRLLRFAQAGTKRYVGTFALGEATDSLDADGVVTARAEVPELSAEHVAEVAAAMTGPSMQRPPMVSAVQVNGRRLHELAREGVEVEREPRPIVVDAFDVAPTDERTIWRFAVTCSPGTYVRVLVAELAESLGTLGHLTSLRRTASGAHDVDLALSLEEIERRTLAGDPVIAPPRTLVADLESIVLSSQQVVDVRHGKRVALASSASTIAGVSESGSLVAVLVARGELYQPDVVMPEDEPRAEGR
jgi:tRNA pseudouridine55 synthase